jgi:hypothetical protein
LTEDYEDVVEDCFYSGEHYPKNGE